MAARTDSKQTLLEQVRDFTKQLQQANEKRNIKRQVADYDYIVDFYNRIIKNRNDRADEIDSPTYKKVIEITKKMFPYPVSLLRCIDGRAFGPLIGLFGHVGESVTVAGGTINEFVRHEENQEYYLLPESNYAQHLRKALQQHTSPVHVEVMDSHLGCAAREAAEKAKGKTPKDHGLFADVIQKEAMRDAVVAYITKRYNGKRNVLAMQISLDLHNGFMYMGLGTQRVIEVGLKNHSYDDSVIKDLVAKKMIISTEQLTSDPIFVKVFERFDFPIDLTAKYKEGAIHVWESVEKMYPILKKILNEKLYEVYPRFKDNPEFDKEVEERSIILLVNTFIGFLHQKHFKTYPFAQHNEEGIFMGKGANTPYEIDMFGVSTLDMDSVPANVELSAALVRGNRTAKRATEGEKFFKNFDEFIAAPVCGIMQVKVLDSLSESEWEHVSHLPWENLEEMDWTTMGDRSFLDYIEEEDPNLPIAVVNAINKLRHRLAFLYDIDREIFPFLIEQDIVILPVISDTSLRVRAVLPFVKTGYK